MTHWITRHLFFVLLSRSLCPRLVLISMLPDFKNSYFKVLQVLTLKGCLQGADQEGLLETLSKVPPRQDPREQGEQEIHGDQQWYVPRSVFLGM